MDYWIILDVEAGGFCNHALIDLYLQAGVTDVSPMAKVPSVKILGIDVNFEARKEMEILPSFLRCFPNVEALHIKVVDMHDQFITV